MVCFGYYTGFLLFARSHAFSCATRAIGFYGATSMGGTFGIGTIFEYNPNNKTFTKKLDFENVENSGAVMASGFVESSNGKLYGSFTQGGSMGLGSFFEYDPQSNTLAKKQDFIGSNGLNNQSGPLVFASMQPQSLTFAPIPEKKFADPPFILSATTNSVFPITFSSSNPEIASISGNIVTINGGGTVEIIAYVPGTINLHSAKVKQTITIKKLGQSITFDPISDKEATAGPFTLVATASSNLPVSFTSTNLEVVTIFGDVATIKGAGEVEIVATQEGNLIYERAELRRKFKVSKVNQSITFEAIPDKTMLDVPFTLNATATSNLSISYTISDTSIANINGNLVTIKKHGIATITVRQLGNQFYNAAAQMQRTLRVSKVDQTITFEPIPGLTTRMKTYQMAISISSGQPITITSSDTTVAKVEGTTLVIGRDGTTRITASQAGNNIYNPANTITQNVVIKLVTSANNLSTQAANLVYPNPAHDEITLELPSVKLKAPIIQAFDMVGRMVALPLSQLEIGLYQCNVSTLKSGRYLLQIPDSGVRISLIVVR